MGEINERWHSPNKSKEHENVTKLVKGNKKKK